MMFLSKRNFSDLADTIFAKVFHILNLACYSEKNSGTFQFSGIFQEIPYINFTSILK